MAHRVVIGGFTVDLFLGNLLTSSPVVARHTSIIHLQHGDNGLVGKRYVWANQDMSPWGNQLPPQCDMCFTFRPWSKKMMGLLGNPANITFRCMGQSANGGNCSNVIVFRPPGQFSRIINSDWLSFPWPAA